MKRGKEVICRTSSIGSLSNTVAAGSREVGKVLDGASRGDSIALRGISSPILLAPPKLVSTSNKSPVLVSEGQEARKEKT
jgi:hypothetical protein